MEQSKCTLMGKALKRPLSSRNTWRTGMAAGAVGILGFLAVAAYATFVSLPGRVRIAPVSITVHSSGTLPAEVQSLEAQTAPYLFDRDTTTAHVAYADQSIDTQLDHPSEIQAIKIYGPAPYLLTVQAQRGGTWNTIAGLDQIKLAHLPAGWNTLQAAQPITTGALRLNLTPAAGNAGGHTGGGKRTDGARETSGGKNADPTSGGLPEIEIWATGEHALLNGTALVAAAGSAPIVCRSAAACPAQAAQARAYAASPATATVGKDAQNFTLTLDRPAARFKRAWLAYETYGLGHWVSPVRSINGQSLQGGVFTFNGSDWTTLIEPIHPNWLQPGKNSIAYTLPPKLGGSFTVRNVRIVGELDDGNNYISSATTGTAGAGQTTHKGDTETAAPQLTDGDLTTGWIPYKDPHSRDANPVLTLYFDKPTQLDALNLNLLNTLGGTLSVDLSVEGQWQNAGLQTINGKKLATGWNQLTGFAPVAADALRISFQGGAGSAGEIREITASGSGTGTAYVPAINVAYPDSGQFYGRQAYIRGYLTVPDNSSGTNPGNGGGPAVLTLGGKTVPTTDGSFGVLVVKDDVGYANQADAEPWQVELTARYPNGQKLTQTVKLTQANDASKAHGLLPTMPNPGLAAEFVGGDASLDIGPDALDKPLDIKITALTNKDLPALDPGMTNVTPAPNRGYRFTPHGAHFKKDVKVTLPYDPKLIPAGLAESDIKTFYFDTERGHWIELARYKTDSGNHKVTSLTNHFTDMISATLATPDHPENASFNATQMKDIKAADPGAGINLIEPPKPNNMGDARLSYPIEIPGGRQGMQPQLAISYNSSGGNGWLGLGWDMSVPSIGIDTRWGVPRYDVNQESETYMLNGEMLTPLAHRGALVVRTPEKNFHTRIEGGFRKIIRHGTAPSNYWWEVIDKNGIKNYYGGDGSQQDLTSTLGGVQGVYRWALKKTVDTHGNTVNYHYAKISDPGVGGGTVPGYQLYIDNINYTGQGAAPGAYTVSFVRDVGEPRRPDAQIDARGGFKQVTAALLRRIEVKYNGALVRSYKLNYNENPYGDNRPGTAFNKTLLSSVVQYGNDGATEFNRHNFAYYDEARDASGSYKGFATPKPWNVGSDSVSTVYLFGNGSVSALGGTVGSGSGGSLYVGVGSCCNIMSKGNTDGLKFGYNQSQSETLLVMADMNGDGLPDKVFKQNGAIFYRPNLSGPRGSADFGAPVPIPSLHDLGRDNTTSTTTGAENYYGASAMYDVNDSYTQSDTYITDVNGDGIPDIVSGGQVLFGYVINGIPTFSADSGLTPVTVGAGVMDAANMLADPAAIEAKRALDFPLLDTVRRWVAPFDGAVSINAPVQLIQDTSPARAQYKTADGVRVAIQLEGAELWNTRIHETDYAVKTPSGVNSVQVKKGDRLYFRVQSVSDGSYDQVSWDPEITYLDADTKRLDANNLPVYSYRASRDYTLAGRSSTVRASLTGTLHLAGSLVKNAATSDDVKLVVYRNGTAAYTLPLTGTQTGSFAINQDLQVTQLDTLQWRIETDSPIDAAQMQLTPQAWYTAAQGMNSVKDEKGNYVLQLYPSHTMDLYPVDGLAAPQNGYVVQQKDIQADGTLQVKISATSKILLANGQQLPLTFTVKRGGTLLAKNALTLIGNGSNKTPASTGTTLNVATNNGDVLYFDFISRDPNVSAAITYEARAGMPQGTPSVIPLVPSALHVPDAEGLYPQPYRGWCAFGYNGNSPRDMKAIDQTLLIIKPGDTAKDIRAYAYSADPITSRWGGPDAAAWITAGQASATRLGLKNITMPRGTQFAGASAPPRISHSTNNSVSGFGLGGSNGNSTSQLDFQDLNGDRFPDVVGQGGVQYTGMTGGLTGVMGSGLLSARNSNNTSYSADSSGVSSMSAAIASARGDVNPSASRSAPTARNGSTEPSFGVSGGGGTSDTQSDLMDVNGDGLPDQVFSSGMVALNLGYSFAPPEQWGAGAINRGETTNGGMNLGFSMDYGSISGGLSLGIGDSHTNETYMDINGDGLPDKVTGTGPFSVRLNTGTGFSPAVTWGGGQGGTSRDKNISLGAGGSFTFGIPIPIVGVKIVFTPALNTSTNVGRPELAFRDMDGDGYADQALSITDNQLSVAINQIGRTNLLKEIKRPLGAILGLGYAREGNTYAMPQSRWVMDRVTVNDGHPGDGVDVQETTYRYKDGNYNRFERDFYGYRIVTEEHRDSTNHTLYRKVVNSYLNGNYYDKGLEAQEQSFDGGGNIYLETLNTFVLRDLGDGREVAPETLDADAKIIASKTIFPMLTQSERHFYEGGKGDKSTYTTQAYDALGNITRYFDAGDTGSADDVEAVIGYSTTCTASYVVGKPTTIVVRDATGRTLRSRIGIIDCATGNLTQLSQQLDSATAAVTDMSYDANGNLKTFIGPDNLTGQRYALTYTYDPAVSTYIIGVTDSFNYTSGADYDYALGKPKTSTDLNGNVIGHVYDKFGRTTGVTGPYEQVTGNQTLVFAYHPEAEVPYATTLHLNVDAKGTVLAPIETVLFTDGLKHVLQTKKSATIDIGGTATPMMIASGRIVYDAQGRAVRQYYPVIELLGQEGIFNTAQDNVAPTETTYDILDRILQTKLPDGTITSIEYGFGADRNGTTQFTTLVRDANGKIKETYCDIRELVTSVKEHDKSATLWTSYAYNPMKEIVRVADARNNLTTATYDNLGRRVSLSNPDTGITRTVYDTASNAVQKITANLALAGKAVNYIYDFNRLIAIHYPDNRDNDVTYQYGAAGPNNGLNQIGRIVKVTDASGTEEHAYGKLGETVRETRTIAGRTQGKSEHSPEVYTTQYKYDTFGRILTLTLPDTETVTYGYDTGGNLASFAGDKAMHESGISHTPYLQTLLYDKFEQRTYLKLGNGVDTHYTYNPQNRRLANLLSQGIAAGKFQNMNYTYDPVGNIIKLVNDAAVPAHDSYGGPTSQNYGYDDLYRLTSANGTYQSSPKEIRKYTLSMAYDDIHNIVHKNQADAITHVGEHDIPQKSTSYDWAYAYGGMHPHAPTHIGNRTYTYDANGNQLGWRDDKNETRRIILWDEDNRISEIDDNGERSKYTYDAQGQRTIKTGKQGETVYVNQYYVVRNRSIVSKQYYAGSSRLVTRMVMGTASGNNFSGAGGAGHGNQGGHGNPGNHGNQGHQNNQGNQANQGNNNGGVTKDMTGAAGQAASPTVNTGLDNALSNGQGNKYGIYKRMDNAGGEKHGSETQSLAAASGQDEFTYYYHPDHLGSTGYVTDGYGKLYEHLEYFPFGETWVQEHSNTLRTPYLFTGKEYDQDTGLYYFGARYYDPRTSVWQSADPILGKYLPSGDKEKDKNLPGMGGIYNSFNLAMYSYAHNTPLCAIDPDGERTYFVNGIHNETSGAPDYSWKFGQALADGGIDNVKIIGAFTDEKGLKGYMQGVALASVDRLMGGFSLGSKEMVRMIREDIKKNPLKPGEQINLIGYSGGGQKVMNASDLLKLYHIKVDNVILIGAPISSPSKTHTNIGQLSVFYGDQDPLATKNIADSHATQFRGMNHINYFDVKNIDRIANKAIEILTP